MIAVCLLTCDRRTYTQTTVQTFAAHNDLSKFTLLHADDASTDPVVPALARSYGFQTVARSTVRRGWLQMRTRLFEAADKAGAEWCLFLENDIEWARPFPWDVFTYIQSKPQFYCLRLYGEFKDRARQDPSFIYNKLDRTKPVRWVRLKFAPQPTQAAQIHWSGQPSVTKTAALLELHQHGMESPDLTARVMDNVTYHIGIERTQPVMVMV